MGDKAGLNGYGAAEPSYTKHRTTGHTETLISGDTRADWSDAFALVPSLRGINPAFTSELFLPDGLFLVSLILKPI
jgi:hypothetical protein